MNIWWRVQILSLWDLQRRWQTSLVAWVFVFISRPISANPATTFEGFMFEDLYYPGKVWPRSCRILKPMELMDMEDEVVVSNSGYHVRNWSQAARLITWCLFYFSLFFCKLLFWCGISATLLILIIITIALHIKNIISSLLLLQSKVQVVNANIYNYCNLRTFIPWLHDLFSFMFFKELTCDRRIQHN